MSSIFGNRLKVSIFGESHGEAIGVTIDGFPAGFEIDYGYIESFMARRAPGNGKYSTKRKEADKAEFISGINNGFTSGTPVTALIYNTDAKSCDYSEFASKPRPSHADYPAGIKYGEHNIFAGGGHFSGRLTAPLCLAGALCKGYLEKKGITITSEICSIGGMTEEDEIERLLSDVTEKGDSVGGIVECRIKGLEAGIGDPIFDGVENRIASAVFGIPAVRGIEFGKGFGAASMRGSEHNDPYMMCDGRVVTKTNNHGGVIGGITTGMPVIFRVAFKPTPSISTEQDTVNLVKMENDRIKIGGRHDPCIVFRALPCVEASAAIALLDLMI